ncbi:MAG: alpha/beta fold hydrolase [Lachnospiraceae bacterium]|nr:alpha/beta fold hydrolase [Lachnospiraceae bacterium]
MVNRTYFTYPSRDGFHTIHAMRWQSDETEPIGVLQLVHGMAEYIARYEEVAVYFAKRGFVVVGDDHLGHGDTAKEFGDYGYFCRKDSVTVLVRDEHRLKKIMQKEFGNLPYFILGHSMGSLMLRHYLCRYGTGIDGAVICSTPNNSRFTLVMGEILTGILKLGGKDREKSAFMDEVVFGSYNKRTKKRTSFDWLSTDESAVAAYMNDPGCGFLFTVNGFNTLTRLSEGLRKRSYLAGIPKKLPILLLAGTEDPVGNYGKAVKEVYDTFLNMDINKVQMKLYKDARHELFHEKQKEQTYEDIYNWLTKVIYEKNRD